MALDPVTAGIDAVTTIVSRIWPDKTEAEKAQLAAAIQLVSAQTDIDKAEATSSDPLQHWRGGLGWVCVMAYFWNFVAQPLVIAGANLASHALNLPPLDIGPLATLTLGMLGLGGLHVAERIKGAA